MALACQRTAPVTTYVPVTGIVRTVASAAWSNMFPMSYCSELGSVNETVAVLPSPGMICVSLASRTRAAGSCANWEVPTTPPARPGFG